MEVPHKRAVKKMSNLLFDKLVSFSYRDIREQIRVNALDNAFLKRKCILYLQLRYKLVLFFAAFYITPPHQKRNKSKDREKRRTLNSASDLQILCFNFGFDIRRVKRWKFTKQEFF